MPAVKQPGGQPRALRADAAHNREQILEAARQVFAERGLGVRLDEIAEIAGVGVGTVYRRFKDKDELIRVLFEQSIAEVITLADDALVDDDGTGLRGFLEQAFGRMGADRGLQQILTGAQTPTDPTFAAVRAQIEPRVAALAANAHKAGRLRADVMHGDLPVIQIMLSAAMGATIPARGELGERYARLLLDALEPQRGQDPLPGDAPTDAEVGTILQHWRHFSA